MPIPFAAPSEDAEFALNCCVTVKEDYNVYRKGDVIAECQIELTDYKPF